MPVRRASAHRPLRSEKKQRGGKRYRPSSNSISFEKDFVAAIDIEAGADKERGKKERDVGTSLR